MIATATEGGAALFPIFYYNKEAFLAQSPQLYKEQLTMSFEKVFEIAPIFRAEPSRTNRHLSEAISIDFEEAYVDYNDVMKRIEEIVKQSIFAIKKFSDDNSGTEFTIPEIPDTIPQYTYNELLEKILIVIKDYCHENNIKLLLILGTVHQQFSQVNYKNKSDLVNYNLPTEKIIDILDSLDIDYIDSTKEMLEQHSIDDPVIFEDGHINIKGHKIFANLIEGKLKQKKWL